MTFRELARGVAIFDRYVEGSDSIAAGHDELSLCRVQPTEFADGDIEELVALGWFWEEDEECWRHFT